MGRNDSCFRKKMQLIEVTTGFETRDAKGNEVVAIDVAIDVATVVATVDCNSINSTFAEAADCKSRSTNSHAKCSDCHHGMTRLFFIQLIRPMCPFVLLDLRCGFIALDSLMRAGLVYAGKADVSQPTTHSPFGTKVWHVFTGWGYSTPLYGTLNDPIAEYPRCESAFNA